MIEKFYLFSDMNRDSRTWSIEEAFAFDGARIIAMGDDEDAYLFSMQLILGSYPVLPFQKFHDDYWDNGYYKVNSLQKYLNGIIFCTDPRFLDYMMNHRGDLIWQKNVKEKVHWSQPTAQHRLLRDFL